MTELSNGLYLSVFKFGFGIFQLSTTDCSAWYLSYPKTYYIIYLYNWFLKYAECCLKHSDKNISCHKLFTVQIEAWSNSLTAQQLRILTVLTKVKDHVGFKKFHSVVSLPKVSAANSTGFCLPLQLSCSGAQAPSVSSCQTPELDKDYFGCNPCQWNRKKE